MRRNVGLHRVKRRNILHTIRKRKSNTIGHIMRWNCLLWHVTEGKIEGRIEVTGRRERRLKQLLDDLKENKIQGTERSSRSHYLQNSLWKRLRTCRKTDYIMNEFTIRKVFLKETDIFRSQTSPWSSCTQVWINYGEWNPLLWLSTCWISVPESGYTCKCYTFNIPEIVNRFPNFPTFAH